MAALDGKNTLANQIARAARVVLRDIARILATQWELRTYCYLLHHLLDPQCPLVEALWDLIVTSNDKLSSFLVHMVTIH